MRIWFFKFLSCVENFYTLSLSNFLAANIYMESGSVHEATNNSFQKCFVSLSLYYWLSMPSYPLVEHLIPFYPQTYFQKRQEDLSTASDFTAYEKEMGLIILVSVTRQYILNLKVI